MADIAVIASICFALGMWFAVFVIALIDPWSIPSVDDDEEDGW